MESHRLPPILGEHINTFVESDSGVVVPNHAHFTPFSHQINAGARAGTVTHDVAKAHPYLSATSVCQDKGGL